MNGEEAIKEVTKPRAQLVDKTVDDQVSDVEEVSEDNKETIGLLGVEDSGDDEEPKGKNVTAQRTANDVRLELLENKLESLQSNVESLQSNMESLQSNVESLQSNEESLQSNMESLQSNMERVEQNHGQRIEDLENGLWFDAYRITDFSANRRWTPITYEGVRTNTNVLDVYQLKSSGEFRAPIAGAYQFTLQVAKKPSTRSAGICLRKNQDIISIAGTSDSSNSDSLSTTAMVELKVGDIVKADTLHNIYSYSSQYIHFTGLLLSRN